MEPSAATKQSNTLLANPHMNRLQIWGMFMLLQLYTEEAICLRITHMVGDCFEEGFTTFAMAFYLKVLRFY